MIDGVISKREREERNEKVRVVQKIAEETKRIRFYYSSLFLAILSDN